MIIRNVFFFLPLEKKKRVSFSLNSTFKQLNTKKKKNVQTEEELREAGELAFNNVHQFHIILPCFFPAKCDLRHLMGLQ